MFKAHDYPIISNYIHFGVAKHDSNANTKTLSSWLEAEFPERNLTMKVHTHVQSPGRKHVCWVFFVTDFVVSCCINVSFNVFCICISAGQFVDLI